MTMAPLRNRVIQLSRYGGPEELHVVEAPLPTPGKGEVRVRVLASGIEYTDTLIRRHMYPQTALVPLPFIMGYDVVGKIDKIGEGVRGYDVGDIVADMTVIGSNATFRTLRASNLARVPGGVDVAEVAALILSWMTAYQLLHRAARVRRSERMLVHGAAGAVGQALLVLGQLAGLQVWGAAHGRHSALISELGAVPIDYDREDFSQTVPGGFDVVVDGIGKDGYRKSFAALSRRGRLIAIGYSAAVQEHRRMATILAWIGRLYLWSLISGGRRASFFSINLMRALRPGWFKDDLEQLISLLASGKIHPQVTEIIPLNAVAEAHRRLEAGGLEGKLVLCPELE